MEKKVEPVIGIWNSYDDDEFVTFEDLKNLQKISAFTMEQYCDRRCSTNLTRFNYCPFSGQKIDWGKLKELAQNT